MAGVRKSSAAWVGGHSLLQSLVWRHCPLERPMNIRIFGYSNISSPWTNIHYSNMYFPIFVWYSFDQFPLQMQGGSFKMPQIKAKSIENRLLCKPKQLEMGIDMGLVNYQWILPLCDSFFGALHIFEYIRIFEYETEWICNIRILQTPLFVGHSSHHA